MVKEPKVVKSFSWAFSFKYFHNYNKKTFGLVYSLNALVYGLKFILELKTLKFFKIFIPNRNGPFKNQ
jgi:hypothetical protein